MRQIDLHAVADHARFGRFHAITLFWCALIIIFDGYDLAIAGIQADDDLPWKSAAGIVQETWVLHRCRADDDVTQAVVQITLDGIEIADTATKLHRNFIQAVIQGEVAHCLQNRHYRGLVFRLTGKSAVQVHQMQPSRTLT